MLRSQSPIGRIFECGLRLHIGVYRGTRWYSCQTEVNVRSNGGGSGREIVCGDELRERTTERFSLQLRTLCYMHDSFDRFATLPSFSIGRIRFAGKALSWRLGINLHAVVVPCTLVYWTMHFQRIIAHGLDRTSLISKQMSVGAPALRLVRLLES